MNDHMSYYNLSALRQNNVSWRLLTANNAPFVISFLYREFMEEYKREIPEDELISHLESYMENLEEFDDTKKTPYDYITSWASEEYGYIRRFRPVDKKDDTVYTDLTPKAQKAIEYILGLKAETFIGAESKLMIVFNILEEIKRQSEADPDERLKDLLKRKADIENEINKVKSGEISVWEDGKIKENFLQTLKIAGEISSDFRELEQNFRDMHRNFREKFATWQGGKGNLVENYFDSEKEVMETEQGRSFKGFLDLLTSYNSKTHLDELFNYAQNLTCIRKIGKRQNKDDILLNWLEGNIRVNRIIKIMAEDLSRYVDDNRKAEDTQINSAIKNIEKNVLSLQGDFPKGNFFEIDDTSLDINLVFNRPLFKVPLKIDTSTPPQYDTREVDMSVLYKYTAVDKNLLEKNIKYLLNAYEQITLGEVIKKYPLQYGLEELLTYFMLKTPQISSNSEEIVMWKRDDGKYVSARIPKIIFTR